MAVFRNWVTIAGFVIILGSLFSFLLLFIMDSMAHFSNPYVGILAYVIAPGFLILGLLLAGAGLLWNRRRLIKRGQIGGGLGLRLDLTKPNTRRKVAFVVAAAVLFLLISALGSYQTYHFTESVQFCGEACHGVMKPEAVAYKHSPHAQVACTECHIGPGATSLVKAKLAGTYQVYSVLAKKYPKPIPPPLGRMRPAQETCGQCHWPKKYVGNLDRTYHYYLGTETNSPWTIRLLLRVGGGDPTHGPVGGIHWHMNIAHKVEYIATDPLRQKIPWVRTIDGVGRTVVFKTPGFTNDISGYEVRTMDCMDCHNRPAHHLRSPNDAVNLAMSLGHIDPSLPWIKTNAVFALVQDYKTEAGAVAKIESILWGQYPNEPRIRPAIAAVQEIYKENFFPEMKANWRAYPNNIGHKDWPGCFRCHDGKHKTEDGARTIKANDCNACHTILAQGTGEELQQLNPAGFEFRHPDEELDEGFLCTDCHTGGP